MLDYKTVARGGSDEFTVKRSRFIGYAGPVKSNAEASAFIGEIKTAHWDATHNVYAYVLRDGQTRRYSDDGEPQGTAGIPALDVLLKEGLSDCAVVVTRYFGGVMLGAGGLVRAYSRASKIAVEAAGIVTVKRCVRLVIRCDYGFYGRLPAAAAESGGVIEATDFKEDVTITMHLPVEALARFEARVTDLSLGRVKCEKKNEFYAEIINN